MLIEKPMQRFHTRQRDITRENQNAFSVRVEGLQCLLHRVSRAELFFLKGIAGAIADMLLHRFVLMSDDHDRRPARYLLREIDDVVDQRTAGGRMQHFGRTRFHPRAESGGHDDDVDVRGHCSLRIRSRVRP